MQRRTALVLASQAGLTFGLAGCGFQLRGSQSFAFSILAILPNPGGPLAVELRRTLSGAVQVLAAGAELTKAQLVLEILQEQREKIVVGMNSSGQVRELQLRIRLKYKIRTPQGQELAPETEILQQRDISFNESAVLSKEAEETLFYRAMQTDIVQQMVRRLAAVHHAVGS